LKRLHAKVDR
jgi:hypothetical protein